MGDPFHDPNSEQKWAEWHTAPEVTQRVAKVDLSKEERLWYYLGKTSTEARPQYTENPARPRNNPKSNFLDSVKPPPPPIPTFNRTGYTGGYSIKPAPIAVPPRTPIQQVQGSRPYQYKPKDTNWKSPVWNPDTRKNPNSPVAHQPNVSYDHRVSASPYGQTPSQGFLVHRGPQLGPEHQFQYHSYIPPQYSASTHKGQPTTGLLNGVERFAQPNSSSKGLPPYPYSEQSRHAAPAAHGHGSTPSLGPAYSPTGSQGQAALNGRPAISSLLSNPSGTPKPPMYAVAPSSSVFYAAQSPTEYLAYVTNYPYLKNAYLRRAKTYVSPYSLDGGIAPEWKPKAAAPGPSGSSTTITPTSVKPEGTTPSQAYFLGAPPTVPLASRPSAQFQSPDAFQHEIAKTSQSTEGPTKWEKMLKHLATSSGSPATSSGSASSASTPARYPPLGPRSSLTQELPKAADVGANEASLPSQLKQAPRPTPSPITDDEASSKAAPAEAKPAVEPLQPTPHQVHGGETWRYS